MPISLDEIEGFLKSENLVFTRKDEYLQTSFTTEHYRDQEGKPSVFIVIRLEEGGEYIKIFAPNLYNLPAFADPNLLFQALLEIAWKTKLVQYEYDRNDGELRAIVEFPLEDSTLTRRQFMRALNGLVQITDEYAPVIDNLMLNGVLDFESSLAELETRRLADEYVKLFRELRQGRTQRLFLEE